MDFEAVLPGVTAGKFDLGVSGISVTDQRKKNALFTDPYCLAAQAIVVVEGSPITSKADLDGKKISVQTGTTAETFCMGNGYDVSPFAANADAELALVNGKVDAWVIDDLTAVVSESDDYVVAPDNAEGIRASKPDVDGWFLLRLSVHDPVMPLNIESNTPGGVDNILRDLREFFRMYEVLDSDCLQNG
jgi:hypothetical protein